MPWRWKSKEGKNNTGISHCQRFNKFIKSVFEKKYYLSTKRIFWMQEHEFG